MTKLSRQQQEAIELVRAGRVQYGAEYPNRARRQAARGQSQLWPVWIIDGAGAYGQQGRTLGSLEERGLIVVRHDLVAQQRVPERTATYVDIGGGKHTRVLPEHDAPADPGWRASVQLSGDPS